MPGCPSDYGYEIPTCDTQSEVELLANLEAVVSKKPIDALIAEAEKVLSFWRDGEGAASPESPEKITHYTRKIEDLKIKKKAQRYEKKLHEEDEKKKRRKKKKNEKTTLGGRFKVCVKTGKVRRIS